MMGVQNRLNALYDNLDLPWIFELVHKLFHWLLLQLLARELAILRGRLLIIVKK